MDKNAKQATNEYLLDRMGARLNKSCLGLGLSSSIPLVVDLDGTLIRTDLLVESGLGYVRAHVFQSLRILLWLREGKAALKEKLSRLHDVDVEHLPYSESVLSLIRGEREKGRKIILATASHRYYAEKISDYLGLFDDVLCTEGHVNLAGGNKRNRLVALYGIGGFDYVGNSYDDLAVWESARKVYIASVSPRLLSRARKYSLNIELITVRGITWASWLRVLRIHQWLKNILIFVPLVASHQAANFAAIAYGIVAFALFGLCASSAYVMNDLFDLKDDRRHLKKRGRMFASGEVPVIKGVLAFPLLLMASFAGAFWLMPIGFCIVMAIYYFITLAYSASLKKVAVVDVIALAVLYTLRIISGAYVFDLRLSFWVIAFSMFFFFSLALVKRCAELMDAKHGRTDVMAGGRGYYPDDCGILVVLGTVSGYLSIVILAFYIQNLSAVSLYRFPQMIWLACPIALFWVSRIWLLTHRGVIHEDPMIFAMKDKISWLVGILCAAIFFAAS